MTKLARTTGFERTTAVEPIAGRPGEFAVVLDEGWASLAGVHGGYLCAIAVRGAEALVEDRSVRTVTTSFVRTGQVGPATLSVRAVREGRSITTIVADLVQHDRLVITSRMTLMTERSGVEWKARVPLELPPPEECARVERGRVLHFERVDGVIDPRHLPFSGGDRAMVRGYVRPLEPGPIDAAWLAMATDWFPPPAFVRLEPPTGGVSIDLTTHIHQPRVVLGEGDWLTGSFEIETSAAGLATEHGRIARRDGTLVAESFQTRLTAQG